MHQLPSLQTNPRSLVGTLLGDKWWVDGELGAGGMGTVYSAVHRHNARRVAIKVLNPAFARDPEVRERFYQEAYAANRVLHPGTVAALDDGVLSDGTPFLVMELLEGRDLEKCLNDPDGTLAEADLLRIINELLSILEAAHDAGILHRDIKPENIFCTTDGRVKLLDFGIAKITDSRRMHQTECGSTIGTPAFMPPEQARGRWDQLDARSDLWSVGATMFTLLSGRMVHERETVNEQLLSAMTEQPVSLRSVAPHVSADVIEIVDRALQFHQSDRYENASEMREALAAALRARGELPPSIAPTLSGFADARESRSHTTHRPVISSRTTIAVVPRTRRRIWWAAAAVLFTGVAGGFYLTATDLPRLPATAQVEIVNDPPSPLTAQVQAASIFPQAEHGAMDEEVPKPEVSENHQAVELSEGASSRDKTPRHDEASDHEASAHDEAPGHNQAPGHDQAAAPPAVVAIEKTTAPEVSVSREPTPRSRVIDGKRSESPAPAAADFDPLAERR